MMIQVATLYLLVLVVTLRVNLVNPRYDDAAENRSELHLSEHKAGPPDDAT